MEQLLGTNLYMSAAYILIATGVVVILISFLGCLGAVKEIKCMLLTVSFFLFQWLRNCGKLAYEN
jgi:tetraspanin-11